MARYKDEQCRRCRREGQKLFLKGARCYSDKCSVPYSESLLFFCPCCPGA